MISDKDVVLITKRQASILTVAIVFICLFIFILGYFWGKQSVIDEFGQKIMQERQSDAIDYTQIMQAFSDKIKVDADESSQREDVPLKIMESQDQIQSSDDVNEKEDKQEETVVQDNLDSQQNAHHYAVLIGFGSKINALSFISRLKNRGIEVVLKTKVGITASGKTKRVWYQVVTKSYDSLQEVQDAVNNIKKYERLKDSDIKIV